MERTAREDKIKSEMKATAGGSIGALFKQNSTVKLRPPDNSTPKGVQLSITEWVQRGKLDRAQLMEIRHQTPKSNSTEEDSINLVSGSQNTVQERVKQELKDL